MKLSELKGIGPKTEELFIKIGISSAEELTEYYPIHYDVYTKPVMISGLSIGSKCAVMLRVNGTLSMYKTGKTRVIYLDATDGTGQIRLIWYNAPYIRSVISRGDTYVFRGTVAVRRGMKVMEQPEIISPLQYGSRMNTLIPVYGLTKGLRNTTVVKSVKAAFAACPEKKEYLPESVLKMNGFMGWAEASWNIHFPPDPETMIRARNRLAFDEFFFFILTLKLLKKETKDIRSGFELHKVWETEEIIEKLPFRLTAAQENVWREIENDLSGGGRMRRLIQGDVGSGKTILAFLAMIMTACCGFQSVLMAPTEVLARQHFEKLSKLVCDLNLKNVRPYLLTGSLKTADRRNALRAIETGEANVIIGTHALIQDSVHYRDLALVITDEQHRFGVYQRQFLSERRNPPHMIVMSATPIPRTLGVIFYGDLDISILDELPAKRLPIKNCVVDTAWRPNALRFIRREIEAGHQAYIICPMIEPSEGLEACNVLDHTREIRKEFSGFRVESLHGRMKAEEKNRIMEEFSEGIIQILVSTTVVEVGVDVPNATVMMIENAERFGLAALHQLRGRVGRGDAQSYCIFMAGQQSEEINRRLDILNHSNNGFVIAEKDFELRGPGDLLGIRQSGDAAFKIADLVRDRELIRKAGEAVDVILRNDPDLVLEEHEVLRDMLEQSMQANQSTITL